MKQEGGITMDKDIFDEHLKQTAVIRKQDVMTKRERRMERVKKRQESISPWVLKLLMGVMIGAALYQFVAFTWTATQSADSADQWFAYLSLVALVSGTLVAVMQRFVPRTHGWVSLTRAGLLLIGLGFLLFIINYARINGILSILEFLG